MAFKPQLDQAIKMSKQILLDYGAQVISDEQKIEIDKLKQMARIFINQINEIIEMQIQPTMTLADRIKLIGNLMHSPNASYYNNIENSVKRFENNFNQFLKRIIVLTYVTDQGNINLKTELEQQQIIQNVWLRRKYFGTVNMAFGNRQNINMMKNLLYSQSSNFSAYQTAFNLAELQQQINKATANRKQVYTVSMERFKKKNMDYKKDNEEGSKNSIYWHLFPNTSQIGWRSVTNGGAVGEGYVSLIINTEDPGHPILFSRNPYNEAFENQVQLLTQLAQDYDSTAGALIGDVLYHKSNGDIQLAVKQGNFFSLQSIGPTLAIAYSILQIENYSILKNIRDILENKISQLDQTSFETIFLALTGKAIQSVIPKEIIHFIN